MEEEVGGAGGTAVEVALDRFFRGQGRRWKPDRMERVKYSIQWGRKHRNPSISRT